MRQTDGSSNEGKGGHGVVRVLAAATLFLLLVAPLVLPLVGVLVSLLTLVAAPSLGPRIWRGVDRLGAGIYALLALLAFWVLPVASFSGAGLESGWFILPLCAPADALGWLVPTGAALTVYAGGCVASIRLARPILWAVGAGAGMVAYEIAFAALRGSGHGFVC